MIFSIAEEEKFLLNLSVLMKDGRDGWGCKMRLEAAIISDILYLVGQRNFYLYQGKVRKFLKSDVCVNHVRHAR